MSGEVLLEPLPRTRDIGIEHPGIEHPGIERTVLDTTLLGRHMRSFVEPDSRSFTRL
jgi:hypothetical protein